MDRRLLILVAILLAFGAFMAGCASVPDELLEARRAYQSAAGSEAEARALDEFQEAERALRRAEKSYRDEGDSFQTRSLGYIAERRVEIARIKAATYQLVDEKEALKERAERAE